ncbi:MAG: NADPH:quinone oxidoreductase family protein [Pseudomonadota bacterium]|nr:NADPH:quinone oxidoreductase family protein [Pseudomonadota bacterium]
MKAMAITELNGELKMSEWAMPHFNREEVLIKVLTTSLNFADRLMIEGKYQEKPQLPFGIGMEVCGLVVSAGSDVKNLKVGDRVSSYIGFGGTVEYVSVNARKCFKIPNTISDEEACSIMIAYASSDLALNYKAHLKSYETLLVLGATSAVGLVTIEVGKLSGAKVVAVARGRTKCKLAREMGADITIDTETENLTEILKDIGGVDVVYDPIGGELFGKALSATNPEGRILPIGFASGEVPMIPANIIMVKNLTIIGFNVGLYKEFKEEVLSKCFKRAIKNCAKKLISPLIDQIFPLEQSNQALDALRKRRGSGKIIIRVSKG